MIDINRYIGIPYKQKGYGFDGADCYGLTWLFLKEEFNITLPMYHDIDIYKDVDETVNTIGKEMPLFFGTLTDNPKCGDIALFNFRGRPIHFGIYIERNSVLHILKGTNATYERIDRGRLKGRLEGIYELKRQT